MFERIPHKSLSAIALGATACVFAAAASAELATQRQETCQTIQELKLSYLRCEHAAQTGQLQSRAIAHCSGIYYELKERAFDNNFGRFRAWYMPIVASQGLGGSSMVVSRDLTVRPACD